MQTSTLRYDASELEMRSRLWMSHAVARHMQWQPDRVGQSSQLLVC